MCARIALFQALFKEPALGPGVGVGPQHHNFVLEMPSVSKNAEICISPNGNIKFALPPTQNPNASQWKIGCVGSPTQSFHIGHVHFRVVCAHYICVGYLKRTQFAVEYGLLSFRGEGLIQNENLSTILACFREQHLCPRVWVLGSGVWWGMVGVGNDPFCPWIHHWRANLF